MDFNPVRLCPYKKVKFGHKDIHTEGDNNMKTLGEDGHLQAKEDQRVVANRQELGERNGADFPSQPSEGNNAANSLIADFYLPG